MKKKMFLIITFLLIITTSGCGNKEITCTYKNENGYKYDSSLVIKYKDNDILSAIITLEYNNNMIANNMCNIFKSINEENIVIKCEDNKVVIDNYHLSLEMKINNYTELKEYLDDNKYQCQ